jgi:hypothetical protein
MVGGGPTYGAKKIHYGEPIRVTSTWANEWRVLCGSVFWEPRWTLLTGDVDCRRCLKTMERRRVASVRI